MPSIVRTTIGDIAMWVRQGPQAAWDIGTSQAVITGDEYGLQPFLHSPLRHEVRTVVDIGANIGAFTLATRRVTLGSPKRARTATGHAVTVASIRSAQFS